MNMRAIYLVSIISAILLLAGCSAEVQQEAEPEVSEVSAGELSLAAEKETVEETVPETLSDWDIVKAHVTNNYEISEEYFDDHFVFVDSKPAQIRSDDFDSINKGFPVIVEDAKLVRYELVLNDGAGREYIVDYLEGIYISEGNVVDDLNGPLAHVSYNARGPTHEMAVAVDKFDAVQKAKGVVDCTSRKNFDVEEARLGLSLLLHDSELVWNWESNGNACFISATKPGEVEVMLL